MAALLTHKGISHLGISEFSIDAAHELARFILDNVVHETQRLNVAQGLGGPGFYNGNNTKLIPTSRDMQKKNTENMQKIILKTGLYICPEVAANEKDTNLCMMYSKPADMTTCVSFFFK